MSVLTSREAIALLVSTGGNAALAAARASAKTQEKITETLLLAAIASDPQSTELLSQQLRLLVVLQMYDAFRLAHMRFIESLPELPPRDVARTYTALLDSMSAFTSLRPGSTPSPTDPAAAVLRSLPPEVAEAVEFFLNNPATPQPPVIPPPLNGALS